MSDGLIHEVDCPFCGSDQNKIFDKEEEWKIVKCRMCGFIYTNPQPTPESLPQYYQEEYFIDKRHRSKFYNEDGSIRTTNESYINRIQDVENYVSERGKILEIGSARGGFLEVLRDRGWEVHGVEISEDAAKIANEKAIQTFLGIFTDYKTIETFNVICMYQTLEHISNPKETLIKAKELLKTGGLVVIEVPNIECFELKLNKERKHLSYDLPRHLNHFSPSFLANELTKLGYEIVEIDRYPPKFLLRLISTIQKGKSTKPVKSYKAEGNKSSSKHMPLLRKNRGIKNKGVKFISRLLPGWRFTITARKK